MRRKRHPETMVTTFVHTLLHQFISSTGLGKTRASAGFDFLCYLLDSIGNPELLSRFQNISRGDPLVIMREVLDIPDTTLCDALGILLERENGLGIVVNAVDNMRGRGSDFIAAVSTFIGRLGRKTSGLKALFTSGPDGPRDTCEGMPCINIQYDKERRGLIAPFLNTDVSNVADECRVSRYPSLRQHTL
jgi:hypothetical protein